MVFEEQVSKLYNEIANKINEMIPAEWEQVYTMAYIDEEGGEVFFNYTKLNSDDLHYYTDIPKDYNVSEKIFSKLSFTLYKLFKKLRELFRDSNQEPWTSCEFDFNNEGKLNVSFDYIDWKNSEFGPLAKENYYEYKKFGMIPEYEYEREEIKEIEQFIKKQEEE
ncbi:TIGR01741 family protein [Staphylococcus haemolyticus]|uniref:TIGR01741 family protein n=1 Tax=Staphylococcus TaxID=1279 RepID=UPI00069F091D|nr:MULTISPECIES: TIGR01741 family protein [Staphylococcus]KAA2274405.1 TIGR01741 family protein [Staphylococcus sp. GDX7P312P]KAA2280723.1 TIGR01741 family protein [Staphylococcus sp. GDX7P459A]PTL04759.1 TIGR01741 family protein [Staphylococcus haemolyticus]PTL14985.1 TIGR01741 family protein [Staphylococcus haemolyticus]UVD88782.1 TIGR01741 family protein [Staphylococcus haemolyticus]